MSAAERADAGARVVDSLDDKAAARIDAFIERLRIYGNG